MLTSVLIHCPYCGEPVDILVDGSVEDQQYIEDCQVCCRPIVLTVAVDENGDVRVDAAGENDG
ncbi:CPXCG motif-containing cysteine-rich protein [Dyella koreensis]|uniref:CPXCG motif-containing cysteine-rich protein n=1 Tax=Dyella koreensis TaxID=311235 RepID=A0ABW8K6P3_9GAMM